MLIVLTSEKPLSNEAQQINSLFEAGLSKLHLRKPTFSIDEYRTLLDQIEIKYHSKIMIHQFPELTAEYKLRGVHFQEHARFNLGDRLNETVRMYERKGFSVTSSFHSKSAITACNTDFEYVLLSPVFSSISKEGYEGKRFNVRNLDKVIIGMGGINEDTLQEAFELGFKGVGVLGGIWNTDYPLERFKAINGKIKTLTYN